MRRVKLVLKLATAALAFLLYVWFAAVRLAPRVKLRKAIRRAKSRSGERKRVDRSVQTDRRQSLRS